MTVSSRAKRGFALAVASVYGRTYATANGTSYVELIASSPAGMLITHVWRYCESNITMTTLDVLVAIGANGAEVNLGDWNMAGQHASSYTPVITIYALPYPILVPTGTRISFKMSGGDVNSRVGLNVAYEHKLV